MCKCFSSDHYVTETPAEDHDGVSEEIYVDIDMNAGACSAEGK